MYYYPSAYPMNSYYHPYGYRNVLMDYLPPQIHQPVSIYTGFRQQNPFPPVNIQQLDQSARKFQALIKEADLFINKIISSSSFARELMNAAQLSDKKKVEELIKSVGISIKVSTNFTPTGIHITLDNRDMPGRCCELVIALNW
ncbi:hypothetical protein OEV98_02225 [Caldibacillus lycopersici]|uniref:Inner spore coat protein n=1 Tax=Perspicuibacillus lycopersici TaxID=1325689 RepID=A0AAE3IRK7_9BACI|nr:hypothetical protein [Perspicuibacillus lycopersici]MCU9612378.1 hypothetical protein [Perspicuibacillus lycopersici]